MSCTGDAMYHLREALAAAMKDPSFHEQEKDPSEFLRALEHLFRYAPIKTIAPDQPPEQHARNVTCNILCEFVTFNT
jgi:hypothetical protein